MGGLHSLAVTCPRGGGSPAKVCVHRCGTGAKWKEELQSQPPDEKIHGNARPSSGLSGDIVGRQNFMHSSMTILNDLLAASRSCETEPLRTKCCDCCTSPDVGLGLELRPETETLQTKVLALCDLNQYHTKKLV